MCAGPSASLTFSWGNCTFNESQFLDSSDSTKTLNCIEPSIVYDKGPAIFTSKYKTGDTFIGKVSLAFLFPGLSFPSCVLVSVLHESCLHLLKRSITTAISLAKAGLLVLPSVLTSAQQQQSWRSCCLPTH